MAGKVQKIDLVSQAFARDPFPTYATTREVGPVFQTRLPLLGKTWEATTYQAASEVLKGDGGLRHGGDPPVSASWAQRTTPCRLPLGGQPISPWVVRWKEHSGSLCFAGQR
jgi:hypothetical protein